MILPQSCAGTVRDFCDSERPYLKRSGQGMAGFDLCWALRGRSRRHIGTRACRLPQSSVSDVGRGLHIWLTVVMSHWCSQRV